MIAHYLLYPDMRHGLDELAEKFLSYKMMPFEEMIAPQTTKQFDLRQVEPERLQFYAAEDTHITHLLYEYFAERLEKAGLTELFRTIEMPLMKVLLGMEREGVRLDKACLARQAGELQGELERLETEISTLIGHPINVNSSKQVGEALSTNVQIMEKAKKTKTGGYTTSEEVLEKLRDKHPVVGKILDYRGVKKLLSTYIEALPDLVYPDGKIHTSFNQTHSRHGSPLQQQPQHPEYPHPYARGRAIREAFVPDAGCTFLSADYSQIELRLMAHFSEDPALIEAFRSGKTSIRLPQRRSTASCPRRSHPTCVAARRPRTSVSSTASPPSALRRASLHPPQGSQGAYRRLLRLVPRGGKLYVARRRGSQASWLCDDPPRSSP